MMVERLFAPFGGMNGIRMKSKMMVENWNRLVGGTFAVRGLAGVLFTLCVLLVGGCASSSGRQLVVPFGVEVRPSGTVDPVLIGGFRAGVWEYEEIPKGEMSETGGGADSSASTKGPAGGENRRNISRVRTVVGGEGDNSGDGGGRRGRTTLGPDRAETIRLDDETGNLVITETIDRAHDARTAYEPALVLIYANQEPGKRYEQSSKATVWSIRNPSRKQDEGMVKRTMIYETDQRIGTAVTGKVIAHRIRSVQTIDFRRADVETETVIWYVEEIGPAAILETERVRAIGPLGWSRETALRLVSFRGK